jgi:hypothetical protein
MPTFVGMTGRHYLRVDINADWYARGVGGAAAAPNQ